MQERRRDERIDVDLPFMLSDGEHNWQCHTVDISPTGLLLAVDSAAALPEGARLRVAVQGPTENGWEHINTREVQVVRQDGAQTAFTYTDIAAGSDSDSD